MANLKTGFAGEFISSSLLRASLGSNEFHAVYVWSIHARKNTFPTRREPPPFCRLTRPNTPPPTLGHGKQHRYNGSQETPSWATTGGCTHDEAVTVCRTVQPGQGEATAPLVEVVEIGINTSARFKVRHSSDSPDDQQGYEHQTPASLAPCHTLTHVAPLQLCGARRCT